MYDFKPIIEKNKKGESMPSRHVFSAFIIGMAFLYIGEIPLGIIGLIIAIVRVISGVHFPKDVIVGALVGILCGAVGFFTF